MDTAVSGTAVSDTVWPELAESGSGPSDAAAADPAVLAILDGVRDVPGLPVSEHQAAYAGMHDALLEALNQEPLNQEPLNQEPLSQEPLSQEPQFDQPQHEQPRPGQPRPGPGAA